MLTHTTIALVSLAFKAMLVSGAAVPHEVIAGKLRNTSIFIL